MRRWIENFFAHSPAQSAIPAAAIACATPPFAGPWLHIRPVPLGQITGRGGGKGSNITWTEIIEMQIARPIEYLDEADEYVCRIASVAKRGFCGAGLVYLGVYDGNVLDIFPADRLLTKIPALSGTDYCSMSMRALLRLKLPRWPHALKVVRIPCASGKHRWSVNFEAYSCSCPETRWRRARFEPAQLGTACPHVVTAIRQNLGDSSSWPKEVVGYLNRHDAGSRSHCF